MNEGTEADDNVTPIHGESLPSGGVQPPTSHVSPSLVVAAPIKVPKLPLPGRVGNDRKAKDESKAYENRDLDGEARRNDHDRMETLRSHVHLAEKILLWISVGLLALGLIEWSLNELLPDAWSWLKPDQLATIQHILTTVAVSGLVGGLARRVMSVPGEKKPADPDC